MNQLKIKPGVFSANIIKSILISLVFIGFCILSVSAQSEIKQLELEVESMNNDTAKVNVLITLGKHYCSNENDKALMYLQEAFTIAGSLNYASGIGKSLLWQGRVYYYKDDYTISNKYLNKAKEILETTEETDDLAFAIFAKAVNCRIRGDYIHALELYDEAIKQAQKTSNKKLISSCYSSIGVVHLERKNPRKAMTYFMETLAIKEEIDDENGISNTLTCIGKTYEELNNYDSALFYYYKALKIRIRLKIPRAIASSEYNIGSSLIKKGENAKAEESLMVALNNFSQLEEKTGLIITKLQLAIAQNKQEKSSGIDHADKALKMALKIDNPNLICHAYQILSEIYFFNSNYKKSYEFLVKFKTIQDSLLNTEKERMLTEFETKFQSEKKDNQIKLLKSKTDIQHNNNILLIILSIVFAIVIVLLFLLFKWKSTAFNRQEKLMEQEKTIHKQEKKITEKENQILQEQLESKNRELASKALEMLRLNETISSIIENLENLNNNLGNNPDVVKLIKEIINKLENQTKQNIWIEFEKIFKNIHSGFYSKLLKICPELTATEIRTAALLKLNLTTKEIAAIAFKSEGSIKTTRYRLRKKLNLSSEDNLVPYLMQI